MSSATHSSFGMRWLKHLVSLHHAVIGEVAIIFIILATPRERHVATTASTLLGELGCAIEIAKEQIHRTLQNLRGCLKTIVNGSEFA